MGEYADIKDRIRQLRKANKWSQDELANKLGVTKVAVSQWERGVRKPSQDMREALCDLFNVNMEYLMGNWDRISRLVTEEEAMMLDNSARSVPYYFDDETAEMAQQIFDNPSMRVLFDAARSARPEDLKRAAQILQVLKGEDDV